MNWPNAIDTALGSADTLATAIGQLKSAAAVVRQWLPASCPQTDYENLRLDVVLDITDPRGRHAVLARRQLVCFLIPDTGVVRDLIWGNGNQVTRYTAHGANRLGLRPEGPLQVMLLGLPYRPVKGERVLLQSRRTIHGALRESSEYCEMFVERPTRRLALKVLFPRSRPPTTARVVTSPDASVTPIPVRYGADGRPFLQWGCTAPKRDWTYSLRWAW
jgi:hypothetical protein